LLWLFLLARHPVNTENNTPWQETLIQAGLLWSAFLVFGTEFLSLFKMLTPLGISLLWLLGGCILAFLHWRKATLSLGWANLRQLISTIKIRGLDRVMLLLITITLVILFITGILSPPNIHDVMTYHMSRVMQWVQNRSLAFFPTAITWQLWMPPFGEFSLLHWVLLGSGDWLTFLPQWFSLVLTMVAVSGITEKFSTKKRSLWLSALFVLTLPIIVLQASGAKNDIILAFLFAALAYYVIKAANQELRTFDFLLAGITVGLGLLTKGNFPFFALPLLAWLLFLAIKKIPWQKIFLFILIGLVAVAALNAGHWIRNTQTFGGPFNVGDANFTLNARFGLDVVISNYARNAARQMMSVAPLDNIIINMLTHLHAILGVPLFDQTITHGPTHFYSALNREEVASNPLHFGITIFVFIFLLVRVLLGKKREAETWQPIFLGLSAIAGMIIFSAVFRWQTWGGRYFIPYYILFAPVVGVVIGEKFPRWTVWVVSLLLVIIMVHPLINNHSRSFSWAEANRNSVWRMSRKGLQFANYQIYEGAVLELTQEMGDSGCRTYGLVVGLNSPEYLIWASLRPDPSHYYLEHIGLDNASAIHADQALSLCGIIVFEAADPAIVQEEGYQLVKRLWFGSESGHALSLFLNPDISHKP
jgi:4-amino-4-deoxy-L-arabinose transferase-like glycosyltransferase